MDLRDERQARGWSQEELAARTGLSVRTIQRIENGSVPGLSSARLLADALGVDVAEIIAGGRPSNDGAGNARAAVPAWRQTPAATAVRDGLVGYADFEGRAGRPDYWWFFLAVTLVVATATALAEQLGTAVGLVLAVPLVAAGARRLHDTGHSGWWQLFCLAPFGFVVPLVLLVRPTVEDAAERRAEPPAASVPGDSAGEPVRDGQSAES